MADGSVRMQSSMGGMPSVTSSSPSRTSALSVSEVIANKATDATSPLTRKHFFGIASRLSAGGHDIGSDPTDITAELDFTQTDGKGGEVTALRMLVHGVRIVSYEPVVRTSSAGNVAMEKIVIAHEGMTRAGASRSSPDMTHQVRAQLGAHSWAYLLRRPGLLEIYDYPGGYAARFDGIDKGGGNADVHHWDHAYEFRSGKWG
jgi:hypothetical protein